jgi:hypothetical protein
MAKSLFTIKAWEGCHSFGGRWPSRSGSIGSALQRPPPLPSAGRGFKSDLDFEDLSALRDANLAHDQAGVIRDYPNLAVVSPTERTDNVGVSNRLTHCGARLRRPI